jgi:hypothetical protein
VSALRRKQLIAAALIAPQAVCLSSDRAGHAAFVAFVPVQGEPGDAPLTEVELKALSKSASIANAVKNSDCFRTFITRRKIVEANGRTPQEVADHLQDLQGIVPVAFYHRCLKASPDCRVTGQAIAYRQPPQIKIFINRAHFDVSTSDFDVYELAGTLAHEGFGHLLGGYDHSFEWTASRDFSVPYSISGASRTTDDAFRHCRTPLGY